MCWEASYKDGEGNPFSIFDTGTNECPVSLISSESIDMIVLYARTKVMREFGASPYGGDLNKWPAKAVDSFVLIQEEHSRIDKLSIVKPKPQQQQQSQQMLHRRR